MKLLMVLFLVSVYFTGCVEQSQNESIYNNSVIPEYSPVVDLAKKDLSERLKIPVENIQLVKQEAVEWPDTSLGYPEKGMMYAQVITPGFKIILKAGDKSYEYHSDYKRITGPGNPSNKWTG
ncbi:MAG: hypothetical protein FIB07_03935 [Candidatus Methanoperedens sp.]|nr:hypothetical protein [Candidatus Methanoperedens sp.]